MDRQRSEFWWFLLIIKLGVVGLCFLNLSLMFNLFDSSKLENEDSVNVLGEETDGYEELRRLLGYNSSTKYGEALAGEKSEEISEEISEERDYNFIVFTKSFAEAIDERAFLRGKSWLSYNWTKEDGSKISWKHYFLVGVSLNLDAMNRIKGENETYGDIIMSETFTFHRHQIYKIMWFFQHMLQNFNIKFLVQVDDDTIVNVQLLDEHVTLRLSEGRDKNVYVGANCGKKGALRDGAFRVSEDVWPEGAFPSSCSGAGIIYSLDTIEKLVSVWSNYRMPIIGHDDVQIGVLAYIAGDIVATDVVGIQLGYSLGNDDFFLLTAIRPFETGAKLMENWFKTGKYGNETVTWHG